jgi:hypothetical protein
LITSSLFENFAGSLFQFLYRSEPPEHTSIIMSSNGFRKYAVFLYEPHQYFQYLHESLVEDSPSNSTSTAASDPYCVQLECTSEELNDGWNPVELDKCPDDEEMVKKLMEDLNQTFLFPLHSFRSLYSPFEPFHHQSHPVKKDFPKNPKHPTASPSKMWSRTATKPNKENGTATDRLSKMQHFPSSTGASALAPVSVASFRRKPLGDNSRVCATESSTEKRADHAKKGPNSFGSHGTENGRPAKHQKTAN